MIKNFLEIQHTLYFGIAAIIWDSPQFLHSCVNFECRGGGAQLTGIEKRTTRRHPTIKLPDRVKIDAEKAPQNVKRKYECNTMYTDFREDVFLKLIVATK